jgi:hypothetical protein
MDTMNSTQKKLAACIAKLEEHTEEMSQERGRDYDIKHAKVVQSEKEVVTAAKALLKSMKDAGVNF